MISRMSAAICCFFLSASVVLADGKKHGGKSISVHAESSAHALALGHGGTGGSASVELGVTGGTTESTFTGSYGGLGILVTVAPPTQQQLPVIEPRQLQPLRTPSCSDLGGPIGSFRFSDASVLPSLRARIEQNPTGTYFICGCPTASQRLIPARIAALQAEFPNATFVNGGFTGAKVVADGRSNNIPVYEWGTSTFAGLRLQ